MLIGAIAGDRDVWKIRDGMVGIGSGRRFGGVGVGGGGSDGSKWSRVRLDGESVGRDGGSGVGDGNGSDIGGVDGG